MKNNPFHTKLGVLAIAAGALLAGMVFVFALQAFAFIGPTQNPPNGVGAVGSDALQNVSVGTSTTISGTKFLVAGAGSNDANTYAAKILQNNGTPIFLLRDDGAVSIETSTASAGNTIIGGNLTVGGTVTATGLGGSTVSAGNVSAGQFGSNTLGGNYSFPANVGIGTTAPTTLLQIGAGGGNDNVYIDSANGVDLYAGGGAGLAATGNLSFWTNQTLSSNFLGGTTPAMTILSSGNVGIGTAAPAASLEVDSNSGLIVRRASNPDQILTLTGGDGSGNALIQAQYSLNFNNNVIGYPITFKQAGSEVMRIASNGNVGIGTTVPAYPLDVTGKIRTTGGVVFPDGTTQTTAAGASGQVTSAGNVSAGTFGSNTSGGNYTFPASLTASGSIHTPGLDTSNNGANSNIVAFNTNGGDDWTWYINSQTNGSGVGTRTLQLWAYPYDSTNGCCHQVMTLSPLNSAVGFTGALTVGGGANIAGNVGIGTTAPAYPLDVTGKIRTTGGVVFPDGTTQTTAAANAIAGSQSIVTASRALGSTYYAGTTPLFVEVNACSYSDCHTGPTGLQFTLAAYVQGSLVMTSGVYNAAGEAGVSFMVPPGDSYRVSVIMLSGSTPTLTTWTEVPM